MIDRNEAYLQAYLNLAAKLPLENEHLKRRLARACEIVNGYGYEIVKLAATEGDYLYVVQKLSTSLLEDSSVGYRVTKTSCTCPDVDTAAYNLCKHRLAVMLVNEMEMLAQL